LAVSPRQFRTLSLPSSAASRTDVFRGGIQVLARVLSAVLPADTLSSARPARIDRALRFGSVVAGACVSVLLAQRSAAQEMTADRLRGSAVAAMGGVHVARIELTGAGWDACLGQAWNVNDGWARWELRDYR